MKIYSMAEARAKQAKPKEKTGRMTLDQFIKSLKSAALETKQGKQAWWANGQ